MERNIHRKDLIMMAIAIVIGLITFLLLLPSPPLEVWVAAHDLQAGQIIRESDLSLQSFTSEDLPEDVFIDANAIIGQTLAMDRAKGDLIRASALGEVIQLQPNERAMAIQVDDATGLAGLLKPGDRVGVTAIISNSGMGNNGSFAKATVENLRVLYLSPSFEAQDPVDPAALSTQQSDNTSMMLMNMSTERTAKGVVVLAVPIDQQALVYHFSGVDANLEDVVQTVTALELLAVLDQSSEARLTLYLMPDDPIEIQSAGVWLPALVMTPGMTPTPTPLCDPKDGSCDIEMTPVILSAEQLTLTPVPTQGAADENN